MPSHSTYQVGGHSFILEYPNEMLSEKELLPYAPFQTDASLGEDWLFILTLVEDAEALAIINPATAHLTDENGRMTVFTREDGGLTFSLSILYGSECGRIQISKDYREAVAWIGGTTEEQRYALDSTLMLLYTFASSRLDTMLVHASTIEYEGKGYLFLGRSGTGKSTHSRLWLEYVKGAELLNDDNPIIRIVNEKVFVYGSPWSGKTSCYRNRRIPVGGIVRLHQAPFNRITPLTSIKAYAALLPSCSCMKWDHDMANAIHSTLCKVIKKIPVYGLECRPDQEATRLSFEALRINKKNE